MLMKVTYVYTIKTNSVGFALKCKPSAHAQLLAHGAWLVAWAIWPWVLGAIIIRKRTAN